MEKNIAFSASQNSVMNIANNVKTAAMNILTIANKPIELLSKYYTMCLDREISCKQTWLLLNAQAAFFMGVFPVSAPFSARLVCLAWLLYALRLCKKAF